MLIVRVDVRQNLVMTVVSGSSISAAVLLHASGLLSGDSLQADIQHVQYLTTAMLRRTG